jgi:hypothetical protein
MEAAKGGTSDLIMGDEVEFHPGSSIILPNGMTYSRARSILDRMQEEAETVRNHSRHYLYRPYDGAVAVAAVMKSMFGVVIGAQSGGGFFSPPEPPETKTVKVSPTETIEVPWGRVIIPALDKTEVHIHGVRHPEHGVISYVEIYTPKKYADKAKAFLDAIDEHLRTKSIYRGKAIVGTEEPEFMDLDTIRPEEIVFSDEVLSTLEGTLWSVLRHREVLKADGVRIKRALLLEGPYGTGKTSAGQLTALEAVQNGWTFIAARPGRDNINEVLRTAKLYQPAVVFIEDVDNQTSTSDKDEVAQLLETFDGVTGKGSELALLMTTNHFERIHKGMLRPGRIDAIVEVAGLDRAGVERLVRAVVSPDRLAADVDFDKVYEAMTIEIHGEKIEFYPAFIREALERAKTFAIGRLDGNLGYMLDTADLVGAAKSLHNQIRAQYNADEGIADLTIDEQLRQLVDGRLDNVQVLDEYGDDGGRLQVKK